MGLSPSHTSKPESARKRANECFPPHRKASESCISACISSTGGREEALLLLLLVVVDEVEAAFCVFDARRVCVG